MLLFMYTYIQTKKWRARTVLQFLLYFSCVWNVLSDRLTSSAPPPRTLQCSECQKASHNTVSPSFIRALDVALEKQFGQSLLIRCLHPSRSRYISAKEIGPKAHDTAP